MTPFPSIESLRHVVKSVESHCKYHNLPIPVVDYIGTVKLHGSNASVRFTPDGDIIPQSRNRILSVGDDNFGFAAFVEKNKDIFKPLAPRNGEVTFYGEWCGGNVQPKVALEQLEKHFVIFSMLHNGTMSPIARVVSHSEFDITTFNKAGIYFINQIPLYKVTVDFSRPEDIVDHLTDLTIAVEKECPWGKFRVQQQFNNTCTIENGNITWDYGITDCKIKNEIEAKILQYVQANNLACKRITISV